MFCNLVKYQSHSSYTHGQSSKVYYQFFSLPLMEDIISYFNGPDKA